MSPSSPEVMMRAAAAAAPDKPEQPDAGAAGERRPSICFVAPNNYALLSGRADIGHIGGAEVQRRLLAVELARRGYRVSFVTHDHGQPDACELDGLRIFKMCEKHAGRPFLRLAHPFASSLWAAMARAEADVYYQRTAGVETGLVALYVRHNTWRRDLGRRRAGAVRRPRFIFGVANDPECDARLGGLNRPLRERWTYYYGLRRADAVVAQTEHQRAALLRNFNIRAGLVRSAGVLDGGGRQAGAQERSGPVTGGSAPRVAWIARFSPHKRLEWVLHLARVCAGYHFDVVGSNTSHGGDSVAQVVAGLRGQANVTLHGLLPHREMERIYAGAAAVLCTSAWEGFPNIFLEGWSRGIPAVSTVDPDGVIGTHALGEVAADVPGLVAGLRRLLEQPQRWRACSRNAAAYFSANHTICAAADAFEGVVLATVAGRRA